MTNHWLARLAVGATLLLVIGIAYTLADAAWFVMASPASDADGAAAGNPAQQVSGQQRRVPVAQLIAADLFGAPEAAAPTPTAALDAPVTNLKLQLLGVFRASGGDRSAAIIAERNQAAEVFYIGDEITRNTTLDSVFPDRVLLRRAGKLEALRFPEDAGSAAAGAGFERSQTSSQRLVPGRSLSDDEAMAAELANLERSLRDEAPRAGRSPAGQRSAADTSARIAAFRQKLDENPEQAISELGLQPVAAGDARGYRIAKGAGGQDLTSLGLRAGDVVVSVNGSPVGNLQADQARIDSIVKAGAAKLEVQRGSRRLTITTSLR